MTSFPPFIGAGRAASVATQRFYTIRPRPEAVDYDFSMFAVPFVCGCSSQHLYSSVNAKSKTDRMGHHINEKVPTILLVHSTLASFQHDGTTFPYGSASARQAGTLVSDLGQTSGSNSESFASVLVSGNHRQAQARIFQLVQKTPKSRRTRFWESLITL